MTKVKPRLVTERIFNGTIRVRVTGTDPAKQLGITEAQRRVLVAAQKTQTDCSHICKIAEDVKSVLKARGIVSDDHIYKLNTRMPVKFHSDTTGNSVLQFSLIDVDDNSRYTLEWRENHLGDSLPICLAEIAVAHDEFLPIKPRTIIIDLSKAIVWETGNKDGKGYAAHDRRHNHDTNKYGEPYSRKARLHHRRHCRTDLDLAKAENQHPRPLHVSAAPSA